MIIERLKEIFQSINCNRQVILLGFVCMVTAQPLQQCHIMEAFPYFRSDSINARNEMSDDTSRQELKNRLLFLTELSRFLNRKAPFLLQVLTTKL